MIRKSILGLSEQDAISLGFDPQQFICDPVNYGIIVVNTREEEKEDA